MTTTALSKWLRDNCDVQCSQAQLGMHLSRCLRNVPGVAQPAPRAVRASDSIAPKSNRLADDSVKVDVELSAAQKALNELLDLNMQIVRETSKRIRRKTPNMAALKAYEIATTAARGIAEKLQGQEKPKLVNDGTSGGVAGGISGLLDALKEVPPSIAGDVPGHFEIPMDDDLPVAATEQSKAAGSSPISTSTGFGSDIDAMFADASPPVSLTVPPTGPTLPAQVQVPEVKKPDLVHEAPIPLKNAQRVAAVVPVVEELPRNVYSFTSKAKQG